MEMITKYILMDCEYGGVSSQGAFSSEFTILELYAQVVNDKLEVIDTLDLRIKPDNGQYIVDPSALAAIGLDLVRHDKIAITEGKAKELLYNFLKAQSKDGTIKLLPAGQNIHGDIRYITDKKFISLGNWQKFCSHQTIDPSGLFMLLKNLGKMPQTIRPSTGKISNSLEAMAEFLHIDVKGMHSAAKDVEVFRQVFARVLRYLKNCPKFS